ncbi:hypothetical protein EV121DRAFT_293499 [Schizophyllum commune]|nr:hypothetical protein K525DRAFT_282614 [Schizophyllum commune Loenen D]
MCYRQTVGDIYEACNCFYMLYNIPGTIDCEDPLCMHSTLHRHTHPNCGCRDQIIEIRKARNRFHFACDDCRRREFDRRAREPVRGR